MLSQRPAHAQLKPHTSDIWAILLSRPPSSKLFPSYGNPNYFLCVSSLGLEWTHEWNRHTKTSNSWSWVLQVGCWRKRRCSKKKKKKKEELGWQFPHVETFSWAAWLQRANCGIQQYSEIVKSCSVRIPLMINIPEETLCYSLFRVF